jgi:hypothetical protein
MLDSVFLGPFRLIRYNEFELTPSNFDETCVSGTFQWDTPGASRLLARAFNPLGQCATPLKRLFRLSLVELTDRSRSANTSMFLHGVHLPHLIICSDICGLLSFICRHSPTYP